MSCLRGHELRTAQDTDFVLPQFDHDIDQSRLQSRRGWFAHTAFTREMGFRMGCVYLTADNLDALKQLVKSYAGEVKMIYIDESLDKGKVKDRNKKAYDKVKIRKESFDKLRELWMKINQRYVLTYEDSINADLPTAILETLEKNVFADMVLQSRHRAGPDRTDNRGGRAMREIPL